MQVTSHAGREIGKMGQGVKSETGNQKSQESKFHSKRPLGTSQSTPWILLSLDPGGQTSWAAFPKCVDAGGESFGCNDSNIKTMDAECHSQIRCPHAKT